jgi:hypothetical protein
MRSGGKFGDWPAFAQRDYLFALPDGRSLTIGIWGNDASDTAIDDFAARVISTLRPRS